MRYFIVFEFGERVCIDCMKCGDKQDEEAERLTKV